MAFTYENINDMENIVKATGLSEDELADLIIAKENEGWTNDEIVDLLVSNFDNKEYAGKAQNELDALYSLGFNPPKDYNLAGGKQYQQLQEYKEDPSLFDRFKSMYAAYKDAALQSLGLKPTVEKQVQDVNDDPGLFDRVKNRFAAYKDADEQRKAAERAAIKSKLAAAGESVANSVNDWRDSHPEQWRVGMVNSIFGDNNMLSQYYAAKNAAEEGEKNRESQREYNEYLKEYDRAKAEAESRAAYKKELKEAEVELAALHRDLVKANPSEYAVIVKSIEALKEKYPELESDETETATETAKKAYEDERAYAADLNRFKGQIKRVFANDAEIQNEIERVQAASWIRPDDMSKIVDNLQSMKSTEQLAEEARQSAVAGHSGKKTSESLTDADLTKKAEDAVKNNTDPSLLSDEVLDKIRKLNYTRRNNKWHYRGKKELSNE